MENLQKNRKRGHAAWKFDFPTFLAASCKHMDTAEDCSEDLSSMFQMFDKHGDGTVTAELVRHLLHEAQAPTRLSTAEVDEFMSYAGLKSRGRGTRKAAGKSKGKRERVDYDDLIGKLLFV